MYKLYNVKTWGSLAIHCLLEEMAAPYTNIWMTPEQVREPEFRALSPLGMIPALGLADGRTLYESAAIVSFLVAAHPDKRMSPELGSPDYGEFMSLLQFMSTEIYGFSSFAYFASEHVKNADERGALKTKIHQQIDGYWLMIERRLADSGPWLMGREFSALDLYAFMLSIWGAPTEQALHAKYPEVAKLGAAVRARPKLKAVLESHGVFQTGGYVSSDLG
ncbi:glutathione S-transferase family protein [Aestuariivirga sp.]|uniref:glutathione S-transferase family protein n=1 Tax=Aestuariivirga sp. TaxID=2650926 RepID=UPI0030196BD0